MPLPFRAPISPMLARLARELPAGPAAYEPKWDGFRAVAFVDGAVDLRSRHGRPLARYFPEVCRALAALPGAAVLDGELVVPGPGGLRFEPLLARLHPSDSRVARLAAETPAALVLFDLLADGGEDLRPAPFAARRARLERLLVRAGAPPSLRLTPATDDAGVARGWLDQPPGQGIDGVVAKRLDGPYTPGQRGWIKVKRERTADCVVGGFRTAGAEPEVASLLLGLWDGGRLVHVGVSSSFRAAARRALHAELSRLAVPLAGHPWERGFNLGASPVGRLAGSAGRWDPATMSLDWTALAPVRVAEVAYDQLDGLRLRHPARFVRWRPDRDAGSCALEQLAAATSR